jgi:hypothetical protein
MADDELLTAIRGEIAESPFAGEGHQKLRAPLGSQGSTVGQMRVARRARSGVAGRDAEGAQSRHAPA